MLYLLLCYYTIDPSQTHPLLESLNGEHEVADDVESIGLVTTKAPKIVLDEDDPDLGPLLSQLQSHLETIKANTEQLPAIEREMLRTRETLSRITA